MPEAPEVCVRSVASPVMVQETVLFMQRAGLLVEIKASTGEKTLTNAGALRLHGLLFMRYCI